MAEFDRYSQNYRAMLEGSLAMAGGGAAYYLEAKARWLVQNTHQPYEKILDFGCGVGLLAHYLKKQFPRAQIHGYDPSEDSLAQIPATLKDGALFTPRLEELETDYDLAVLSNVLHHIPPPQRRETLRDVLSRLKQNGLLCIFEHNPLNPLTRWVVNHCPFDEHAVLLYPAEIQAYFESLMVADFRKRYFLFFPAFLRRLAPLERAMAWFPAGAQYAVIGEKR